MSTFRLADAAVADLEDIWDYLGIQQDRPEVASQQIEKIREKFKLLAGNPHIGSLRDDLHPGLRLFPAGSYVVLYTIAGDAIDVLGVIHGARDIEGMFQRGEQP